VLHNGGKVSFLLCCYKKVKTGAQRRIVSVTVGAFINLRNIATTGNFLTHVQNKRNNQRTFIYKSCVKFYVRIAVFRSNSHFGALHSSVVQKNLAGTRIK